LAGQASSPLVQFNSDFPTVAYWGVCEEAVCENSKVNTKRNVEKALRFRTLKPFQLVRWFLKVEVGIDSLL
jgi:hypothetical protein